MKAVISNARSNDEYASIISSDESRIQAWRFSNLRIADNPREANVDDKR